MPPPSSTAGASSSCCRDLLDPGADRVIRELAATGSELIVLHVLSPDELDPALEGDLRLVDTETGDRVDITADLATIDAYKARLAAWKDGLRRPRGQAPGELRRPVVGREPGRADVRRAAPPPGPGLTDRAVHHAARAARPALRAGRHRDVPAQAPARRGGRPIDAAVDPPRGRRRGQRPVAEAPAEPAPAAPAAARRHPRDARGPAVPGAARRPRAGHRPRPGHLGQHGRHGRRARTA